jgi:exodeoxyribonuclease VII small subunit
MTRGRPEQPPGESTLEADLDRLERIVTELEGDGVDLDRALELFEEGITHLKRAQARLTEAKGRVQRVLEDAAGDLKLTDLDV